MGFWEQCPALSLPLGQSSWKTALWPPDLGRSQILKHCLQLWPRPPLAPRELPTPAKSGEEWISNSGTWWVWIFCFTSGIEKLRPVSWWPLLQSSGPLKDGFHPPSVTPGSPSSPSPSPSEAQISLFQKRELGLRREHLAGDLGRKTCFGVIDSKLPACSFLILHMKICTPGCVGTYVPDPETSQPLLFCKAKSSLQNSGVYFSISWVGILK